jgi:hypothetical protein
MPSYNLLIIEDIIEPEPKRIRLREQDLLSNLLEGTTATNISEFVEKWRNFNSKKQESSQVNVDNAESLKAAYFHLKKESDKKDLLIQDLLKKLNDSFEHIKSQADQIKGKN